MNFYLWKLHNMSLTEIEGMFPFERELYVILLKQWLEEKKRQAAQNQG